MENALQKIFSVKDFSIMKNTFQRGDVRTGFCIMKNVFRTRFLYYEKRFL